jgi:transmembrane sensor
MMNNEKDTIRMLFAKFLAGECTPGERSMIMSYFDQSSNEANIRELIREEFAREIPLTESTTKVVEEVYATFNLTSDKKEPKGIRNVFRYLSRPGIAAAIGVLCCLAALFYVRRIQSIEPSVVVTALGEKKQIKLGDGTIVWLNAASKLRYPAQFSGKTREVMLEGEAFFDVAKNADMPFVINSGTLKTTVLGTSFNVRAYQEDKTMTVAVVTGNVKVSSPDSELHLQPNQQAIFNKEVHKLYKKQDVPAIEMASWRAGGLQFRNTTFSEVAAVLRRSRGVKIQYDPQLEDCPIIHADFNERDETESILGTLMISVDGNVSKIGQDTYVLKSTVACRP